MPFKSRDLFQSRSEPLRTQPLESTSSYSDMEELTQTTSPQHRSQRSRRRHQFNPEHAKHRRTRSGCYTCRQRRVKCDESQPICDRCRKGNRECVFPDSTSMPSKQSRTAVKSKSLSFESASSHSGDESDEDDPQEVNAVTGEDGGLIYDESEAKSATTDHSLYDEVDWKNNSTISQLTKPTFATQIQLSQELSQPAIAQNDVYPYGYRSGRWVTLPTDVKLLLEYHKDRLCHYHYAFRSDHNSFLKTTFLETAVNDSNEALLYAVVAFAAYHRNFARVNSEICNFLAYYNQSIGLLQQSLKQPNVVTLLTILQLATIEEFLGDWVNMMGHQKACYQLITNLFNPQTIMENEIARQILRWYIRFDVFAGTLSGGGLTLGHEWYRASQEFHSRIARERPQDPEAKIEAYVATTRVLSGELTMLMALEWKADRSHEQIDDGLRQLYQKYKDFEYDLARAHIDSTDTTHDVSEVATWSSETTADLAFGLDGPARLFTGEDFAMNFVLLDFWTAELVLRKQLSAEDQAELETIAVKQCKMIDAIERSDEEKKGALIGCHSPIGTASLFLPRNPEFIDWSRRKFATLEQLGYMYPAALREQLSAKWGIDVRDSWLSDRESHPAVLRAVREFIDYRKTVPEAALDVQISHMNGILSSLWSDIRRMSLS